MDKEKVINITIVLDTNNKEGFPVQQQEPKVPSPECLSVQHLSISNLDGVQQQAGQGLEHVMRVRRG